MNAADPSGMDPCTLQNMSNCVPPNPATDYVGYSQYVNQQMYQNSNDPVQGLDPLQLVSLQASTPVGYTLTAPENGTLVPVYGNTIFDYQGGSSATETGGDAQRPSPPNNVVKDYNRNLPCGNAANQVMAAVESNFARFGNFTTRGPLGTSESVRFRPPSGTLQAGSSIPITVQVGRFYTLNSSVTVQYANSQSLGFATVPGHLLYPANISFSASQASSSAINFDINLSGNFPNTVNKFLFNMGGGAFEDAQWNHFLGQVGNFCLGGG